MSDSSAGRRSRPTRSAEPNYGDRVPPHNLDAERGLIASIVIDGGDTLQRCLEQRVTPDYFFDPKHQDIFQAAMKLAQASTGIDEIPLTEQLRRDGQLESAGGAAYVNELTGLIASSAHAPHWLAIIREKHFLRQLISTALSARPYSANTSGVPPKVSVSTMSAPASK